MMNISSYSQNTYPKKIVIEGDTIVALKMWQVKNINATFETLNYCNNRLEAAEEYIEVMEEMQKKKDALINDYRSKITDLSALNEELNILSTEADKRAGRAEEIAEKRRKRTKYYAIAAFIAGVTTAITLN